MAVVDVAVLETMVPKVEKDGVVRVKDGSVCTTTGEHTVAASETVVAVGAGALAAIAVGVI